MAGLDDFEREARRIRKEQTDLRDALRPRQEEFLAKKHVVGYGIGRVNNKPVVRFFVERKVSQKRLLSKDRLPRWVIIKKRRVPTEVVAVGRVQLLAATPIGDPAENDRDYRKNGQGTWKMGTKISVRLDLGGGNFAVLGGTSGCLVREKGGGNGPWMLSCAHVLGLKGSEVAQHTEFKDPSGTPLNNYVGDVTEIAKERYWDAGLVECSGASNEIINIGAPKALHDEAVYDGIYVQKSGATTGVTWGQVTEVLAVLRIDRGQPSERTFEDCFAITNRCDQKPILNPQTVSVAALNKFAWKGDSGALVVFGKSDSQGAFGKPGEGLQKRYDRADANEKAKIIDKYDKAALGLLIAASNTAAYGQELQTILRSEFSSRLEIVV